MATTGRFGTGLLGTFGLGLAGLMAYTLAFEGCRGPGTTDGRRVDGAEVAVFFPDRLDWIHFRRAVESCARRGLAARVEGDDESAVVATSRLGRRVRFAWHGVRGVGETREEVGRIAGRVPPPVAVVGSSTTVLTAALAEPLRDLGPGGPVLLVPWATAVMAGLDPGDGRLLEIDRGRSFRFCPDNRRLAESVVDCLIEQDARRPPGRIVLVVDPHDPYSVDLADGFRRAIRARWPTVPVDERRDAVGEPTVARPASGLPTPSARESELADAIWSAADGGPEGRSTWVVLPLQGDPARRMISALKSRSSWHAFEEGGGPLRVICGDGIGRETLDGLTGHRAFPIWCASTSSARSPDHEVDNDTQTLAEIVSAVLLAVDRSPRAEATPDDIRDGLARIDIPAGDPAAFGRPIRFGPDGERRDDPGYILAVRAGVREVIEFARGPDGRWAPDVRSTSAVPGTRP